MDDKQLDDLLAEKAKLKAERKAARLEKRKHKKAKREKKAAEREKLTAEMKEAKAVLVTKVKAINEEIKKIKKNYKAQKKEANAQTYQDSTEKRVRLEEIKEHKNDDILLLKNEKIDLKFEFGKKYNTLSWNLSKWTHGLRKEFNRIIWSSTANTFKYLLIVIVIVLILCGLFMLVTLAAEPIIK